VRIGGRGLFERRSNIPSSIWNELWWNSALTALRKLVGLRLLSHILEFQAVIRSPFSGLAFIPLVPISCFPHFQLLSSPTFFFLCFFIYIYSVYLVTSHLLISQLFPFLLLFFYLLSYWTSSFLPSLLTHQPSSGPTVPINLRTGRNPVRPSKWHAQYVTVSPTHLPCR
jgi:hypothetical protein